MPPRLARPLREWVLATVLLAGLILPAPSASAGTIGISGNTLIAGAEPGDGAMALTLTIPVIGADLVFDGVAFTVVTPGCTAGPGPETVNCALSAFTSLVIIGSSGDDVISLAALDAQPFAITILGRDGDDVLFGSGGDDVMFGGVGDDNLFGGDGFDLLAGGDGTNFLDGEGDAGAEPQVTPLPLQSVPAPGVPALLLGALGALAIAGRRRPAQL